MFENVKAGNVIVSIDSQIVENLSRMFYNSNINSIIIDKIFVIENSNIDNFINNANFLEIVIPIKNNYLINILKDYGFKCQNLVNSMTICHK